MSQNTERNLLFSRYLDLYDKAYYADVEEYAREAQQIARFFDGKTKSILDVGSGTGKHAAELLKKGFQVHCIDISRQAVETTRKNVENLGGTAELADIANFHSEKKFDSVIALFVVFSYMSRGQLRQSIRNIGNLLRDGGTVVFDVVSALQLDKDFKDTINVEGKNVEIEWSRTFDAKSKRIFAKAKIRHGSGIANDDQEFQCYDPQEIRQLLFDEGFSEVEIYSDYEGSKDFANQKTKLYVVGRK